MIADCPRRALPLMYSFTVDNLSIIFSSFYTPFAFDRWQRHLSMASHRGLLSGLLSMATSRLHAPHIHISVCSALFFHVCPICPQSGLEDGWRKFIRKSSFKQTFSAIARQTLLPMGVPFRATGLRKMLHKLQLT